MILVIVRHHYSSWLLPDFAQSKRACSSWPLLLDHISTDLNSSKLKFPIYYKLQQNSFSNLLPFPQSYYSNQQNICGCSEEGALAKWNIEMTHDED